MSDTVWVLRDASGKVRGAAAHYNMDAITDAKHGNDFGASDYAELHQAYVHCKPLPHGYTLTLEALRAPLTDAECDAVINVFSRWMVIDRDDRPEIRERVRSALTLRTGGGGDDQN